MRKLSFHIYNFLITVLWLRTLCCYSICLLPSFPLLSRSATAPLLTAAFSNTRVSRCVRPTTTSRVAVCARPASSPYWAAVSPQWGPNSTPTILCVTSALSPWAKAASKSRRTNPTATPASSNSSVDDSMGLCPHPLNQRSFITLSSKFFVCFFLLWKWGWSWSLSWF